MSVKVLHHSDMDGRCSGAIVKKKFPEAEFFEVDYDKPLPLAQIEKEDIVYIVDFTPSTDADFERIVHSAKRVIWIDHHGKNIAQHKFYDECLDGLRVEKEPSGAGCTWEFLFPGVPTPEAVMLVSDYDCWNFHYGIATKSFEAGLKTCPHMPDDSIWDGLLDENDQARREKETRNVTNAGQTVLKFRKEFFTDIVKKGAFVCNFEGHKILACNMPNVGSNLFEGIDTSDFDIVSTFHSNGNKIIVGLYSENETVDCAELAQKRGGGGHKGASGFECESLPFTDIEEANL